jgi:hypothetical protein
MKRSCLRTLAAACAMGAMGGFGVLGSGCASIAIATAPSKEPVTDDRPETAAADRLFWATLHGGRYEEIEPALERLQAAYLERPNDPRTAAHIAFLHIWRASERGRMREPRATITDDIALARRYFAEAVALSPHDARLQGFLASMTMAEGSIHKDEKLTRRGFFQMNDAVDAWPEFNLFTRGYVMSQLPAESPMFAAALEDQWKNLDVCADARIDRTNPDFSPAMARETHAGPKRACFNSWIAPHNLEGFFLNMGDMLVKAGNPAVARKIYAQAKIAKEYPSWPFKDVLEQRIARADENVPLFRAPASKSNAAVQPMAGSTFSCMGCHQAEAAASPSGAAALAMP